MFISHFIINKLVGMKLDIWLVNDIVSNKDSEFKA